MVTTIFKDGRRNILYMIRRLRAAAIRTGVLAAGMAIQVYGAPIIFTATGTNSASGNALSASASFDITGTTLTLVLTNNKPASLPSDVLTGVMWDMGNNTVTLSNFDADVSVGSTPFPQDLDSNGGNGEWSYAASPSGLTGITQHYGVSTAGLGIFPSNGGQQFNWGLINGTVSPNPAVSGGTFINNSATFTFTLPAGFTGTISNVRFQYGTSLSEPSLLCTGSQCLTNDTSLPEPATFAGVGIALAAIGMYRRRQS